MANEATVQSLAVNRLKVTKPDSNTRIEVQFTTDILINDHVSTFTKDIDFTSRSDQDDLNDLWGDVEVALLAYLDLAF